MTVFARLARGIALSALLALGASYGAHLVSVNAIGKDGKVSDPKQVIPTGRNARSIVTDKSNKFVFVPHLGTDQIFHSASTPRPGC